MLFAAMKLMLEVTRRMGLRPWSKEARRLLLLFLSAAKAVPEGSGPKLTGEQKVLLGAKRLAQSKKARRRISDALALSSMDAWMLQEKLREALEEQVVSDANG